MGMCKGCNEVFSSVYMKNGYCEECLERLNNDKQIIECKKCKTINKITSNFCKYCGNKLSQTHQEKKENSDCFAKKITTDKKYGKEFLLKKNNEYAHIFFEIEPNYTEFKIVDNIYPGSIPKQYFDSINEGFLNGIFEEEQIKSSNIYLTVTINDGSYHDIDSSNSSFKKAAYLAIKEVLNDIRFIDLNSLEKTVRNNIENTNIKVSLENSEVTKSTSNPEKVESKFTKKVVFQDSNADELLKWAELLEKGLIDKEDFEKKKRELI